jgi:HEXXH motif-containing protein
VEQPELSNLEAIIHESSHNKLNLLFHFDPLILNSLDENYYSPFRPDARHLKGVFLAMHAFVPTIYILMKAYKN